MHINACIKVCCDKVQHKYHNTNVLPNRGKTSLVFKYKISKNWTLIKSHTKILKCQNRGGTKHLTHNAT